MIARWFAPLLTRCLALGFLLAVTATIAHEPPATEKPKRRPSPLADAAEAEQWDRVTKLLAAKVDVDAAQVDGTTALHWAAYHDARLVVRRLLHAGAKSNVANRYQMTPLSLACINGNEEVIDWLLEKGADANGELRGGETVLMTAARTGKSAAVKRLLAAGADPNAKEQRGQTALMWAVADDHVEVAKLLLDAGADREASIKSGFTAWFFAARQGALNSARVLHEHGAAVNGIMKPDQVRGKRPVAGTSALVLAVENGHFELAVELLRWGADPNDQRSGFTPLHMMTWVRKPNRGDGPDGAPPPEVTGNVTSLQFVRALVEHGADIDARLKRGRSGKGRLNRKGSTAFLMAADTADVPLMKVLIELGADPTIPNADNCPPILAAAGIGSMAPEEEAGTEDESIEAVAYLLSLAADVVDINEVDDNGETVMHGAAYKNLPKMVHFLHENGAKAEVWNKNNGFGWTPLRIAQGYRPGNFKPSFATIEAIESVLGKSQKK